MNQDDYIPGARDCGDDVAAYALGSLEDHERQRFERHLESCAVCSDELEAFEQVAALLRISAPERRASQRLRRRLMAEVSLDARRPRDVRGFRSWRLAPLGSLSPSAALGGVLAAVVIAVGGLELRASGRGASQIFRAHAAGASAEIRVSGERAVLVVHHFAPPPPGQIYQVWLNRPHRRPQPSSALFGVSARGDGSASVPGNLDGVQQVMVTREPVGGSQAPTRPATITVNLT